MNPPRSRPWLRAAAWAIASALLLAAGVATLVGSLMAWGVARSGGSPGQLQQQAWWLLATTVLRQALLPLWAATFASWLVLVRAVPDLDATWRSVAPGVTLLASLWFAPVGLFLFHAWKPASAGDVAGTLALCAGGVSAAMLLPRLLWSRLAPGAFAAPTAAG